MAPALVLLAQAVDLLHDCFPDDVLTIAVTHDPHVPTWRTLVLTAVTGRDWPDALARLDQFFAVWCSTVAPDAAAGLTVAVAFR